MKESEVLCINLLLSVFPIPLTINVVDSALVKCPNNTAVTNTTNRAEFSCRSDEGFELEWFIQANNTVQRQNLAFGDEIKNEQAKSYCSIENKKGGEFTLILNTKDESAQTYTCQEPDTDQERSAELIIIEPTKFEKDVNESHVTLTCSVNFRGNWAPELELSHNGTSVVDGVNVFVVPNQNVSTTLIIPCNNSACAGNYRCTARFHIRGKPNQTTDNSVPSYMDTSTLTVHMGEIREGIPSDRNSKGSDNTITIAWLLSLLLPVLV